ncbi:hypothetical protein F0L74_20515 [Chitinophaga agrisoli]|uniref:Uncharacterized protein n=1 Tax=Chitinophaga agrisoli TaxID=2607653 RepID=A0A5B2VJA0_9BACT|nr:hypothetical protein [Chitinophaga agrisoli]KAA2238610.1 hypothetical protein F0L74_20515 [Chitinophaga agrisoli]
MRRLIEYLFLASMLFLSGPHGWERIAAWQSTADATAYSAHTAAELPTRPVASTLHQLKPWKEYFKRRPVGLNDGHEEGLVIYSCHIRPQFVYIHTRYYSQVQPFITVAIDLSDWRGPPVA